MIFFLFFIFYFLFLFIYLFYFIFYFYFILFYLGGWENTRWAGNISTQEEKAELEVTSDDQKYTLTIVTPWVYITDKTFLAKKHFKLWRII